MSSRRTLKAASAIKEVVSLAILTELRDPRIENVTVTFVEISGDMRTAKIHVSIMGDEKHQQLCMHGLRRSAGFLQKRVNDRIDTRYTPRLQFVLDKGIQHSFKVAEILKDVLPETEEGEQVTVDEATGKDKMDTMRETTTVESLEPPTSEESGIPEAPSDKDDSVS